jgi:SNF2 family DNA or RNA helicase
MQTVEGALHNIKTTLQFRNITLFPYQEEGIRWMLSHELSKNNLLKPVGLLGDDPGLGKTLQTISLIMGNPSGKTLIVVPVSIIDQWREAIQKILPKAVIYVHHGKTMFMSKQQIERHACNIVLTGYHQIYNIVDKKFQPTVLHAFQWGRLILDECHTIRNQNTKAFMGACALKSEYRWGLSGTPLQNKVDDLKSIFSFLHFSKTEILGQFDYLRRTYILRRNRSIIPDKFKNLSVNIVNIPFDTEEERKFYQEVRAEIRSEYLRIMDEDGKTKMMELFELLLRLRQAAIHPNIVINGLAKKYNIDNPKLWTIPSTKENKLIELFSLHTETDKTIIICHYSQEMDIIENSLSKAYPQLKIAKFNGSMNLAARTTCVKKCMEGHVDVLIMQILCGGVGLNLQIFNKVYTLTPDWNPANEIQAFARCHRIGQQRDVEVFKIIIDEDEIMTIDQLLLNVQSKKRALMVECLSDPTLQFTEQFIHSARSSKMGLTFRDFKTLLK